MFPSKGILAVKAAFLLALLVGLILTIGVGAESGGTWEPDSIQEPDPAVICPSSAVCAEWDVGGASLGSCCISPESLGTDELEACNGTLVQSCEGTY